MVGLQSLVLRLFLVQHVSEFDDSLLFPLAICSLCRSVLDLASLKDQSLVTTVRARSQVETHLDSDLFLPFCNFWIACHR